MNALQETATKWIEQGIGVIPIGYRQKEPDSQSLIRAGSSEQRADGRLRGIWEPFQKRLPTDYEVKCMFMSRLTNLAVVTGWSNLVVLDFDDRAIFCDWWAKYQLKTYMVLTNRGMHVYLFSDQAEQSRKGIGLDIKAAGGYVLAPPSIHPSGKPYQVFMNLSIARVKSIDPYLPAKLFPVVEPAQPTKPNGPAKISNPILDPWQAAMAPGFVIGKDLISAIKEKISLLDLLPGAEQTSSDGRWWMICCPFHADHHPSMWIDTRRGICGCYAGCNNNKPYDVINLWAEMHHISNEEAIKELARRL